MRRRIDSSRREETFHVAKRPHISPRFVDSGSLHEDAERRVVLRPRWKRATLIDTTSAALSHTSSTVFPASSKAMMTDRSNLKTARRRDRAQLLDGAETKKAATKAPKMDVSVGYRTSGATLLKVDAGDLCGSVGARPNSSGNACGSGQTVDHRSGE